MAVPVGTRPEMLTRRVCCTSCLPSCWVLSLLHAEIFCALLPGLLRSKVRLSTAIRSVHICYNTCRLQRLDLLQSSYWILALHLASHSSKDSSDVSYSAPPRRFRWQDDLDGNAVDDVRWWQYVTMDNAVVVCCIRLFLNVGRRLYNFQTKIIGISTL